jgi:hypothetical protein
MTRSRPLPASAMPRRRCYLRQSFATRKQPDGRLCHRNRPFVLVGASGWACPRAGDGGSLSKIGSAVLRRKRPLHDKFAHALHSSVREREMICDRGSAVRGRMTSPDVRATSRAYVAGLERHHHPTLLIPGMKYRAQVTPYSPGARRAGLPAAEDAEVPGLLRATPARRPGGPAARRRRCPYW